MIEFGISAIRAKAARVEQGPLLVTQSDPSHGALPALMRAGPKKNKQFPFRNETREGGHIPTMRRTGMITETLMIQREFGKKERYSP
jgi:hypothetical protein